MTTAPICPGDALIALGATLDQRIVSLLNRWGYQRSIEGIDWIAKRVGSRELAEKALAMSVDCKATVHGRSRGLGDTIAKVTKAVGIKPCAGCKERQQLLNKLVPYKE